ncbi:hypothetical protein C8Q76DRAFT_796734 [Earliella scabrosa]|nr:hypothetical protein C8Q76DRAFT_796734 [Earliella scabrosa]
MCPRRPGHLSVVLYVSSLRYRLTSLLSTDGPNLFDTFNPGSISTSPLQHSPLLYSITNSIGNAVLASAACRNHLQRIETTWTLIS